MSRSEPRDQMAVVLTCEAEGLATMASFYVDVVGFEEERRWVDEAGGLGWIDLRDGALRLKLARTAVLPGWSATPTRGVTLLVEVQDVEGRQRAIARRAPEAEVETRDLGGAQGCVLRDPAGNDVWLIRYAEESPTRIGGLTPSGE